MRRLSLDAGHEGSFSVFEKATGTLGAAGDEAYGHILWGAALQVASSDMLSRFLRLHDLLNNLGNFGFLTTEAVCRVRMRTRLLKVIKRWFCHSA